MIRCFPLWQLQGNFNAQRGALQDSQPNKLQSQMTLRKMQVKTKKLVRNLKLKEMMSEQNTHSSGKSGWCLLSQKIHNSSPVSRRSQIKIKTCKHKDRNTKVCSYVFLCLKVNLLLTTEFYAPAADMLLRLDANPSHSTNERSALSLMSEAGPSLPLQTISCSPSPPNRGL